MSSIDDAIEAMYQKLKQIATSPQPNPLAASLRAAVESGHLVPADQLEQVGWLHADTGVLYFNDDTDWHGRRGASDWETETPSNCPGCVPVYRKREPR